MSNIIKGFIIGIGKIVPGVSGSMLAISLGVYEKALMIVANIRKASFKNLYFLLTLSIGAFIGITIFSRAIKYLLDIYYLPTMLLFIGLIIGGITELVKEVKKEKLNSLNGLIFILSLTFSYTLTLLGHNQLMISENFFIYFIIGLIEAFSSIVPGISGTAIFMSLGVYDLLLTFFSNIFNPAYFIFGIFFLLGVLTGIFLLAKLITYLLKNYKGKTYIVILGFMLSSIVLMFQKIWHYDVTVLNLIIGLVLLVIGYKITIKISKLMTTD